MKKSWMILVLLASIPALAAVDAWQIKAPRGTDIDLETETIQYYGDAQNPVEAVGKDSRLMGETLEYQRKSGRFIAKGQVVLTRSQPKLREYSGALLFYDEPTGEFQMPMGGKIRLAQEQMTLEASRFSGNARSELFQAEGSCKLVDQNGVLTSDRMEGDAGKGQFFAEENVIFTGKNVTIRSKRAIYHQKERQTRFLDKPVVTRDKEVFTATEIIYDLKANKVKAIGPVEYRSQTVSGEEKNVH